MSFPVRFNRHFLGTSEQKIRRTEQSRMTKIWINAIADTSWLPVRCTIAPTPPSR
jgi:hypothetical protein